LDLAANWLKNMTMRKRNNKKKTFYLDFVDWREE
jgi:hypothetical protein